MLDTRKLNEQGLSINNYRIEVAPMSVFIETTNFSWKLPQSIFKRFAEWYMEDQIDLKNYDTRDEQFGGMCSKL